MHYKICIKIVILLLHYFLLTNFYPTLCKVNAFFYNEGIVTGSPEIEVNSVRPNSNTMGHILIPEVTCVFSRAVKRSFLVTEVFTGFYQAFSSSVY